MHCIFGKVRCIIGKMHCIIGRMRCIIVKMRRIITIMHCIYGKMRCIIASLQCETVVSHRSGDVFTLSLLKIRVFFPVESSQTAG